MSNHIRLLYGPFTHLGLGVYESVYLMCYTKGFGLNQVSPDRRPKDHQKSTLEAFIIANKGTQLVLDLYVGRDVTRTRQGSVFIKSPNVDLTQDVIEVDYDLYYPTLPHKVSFTQEEIDSLLLLQTLNNLSY